MVSYLMKTPGLGESIRKKIREKPELSLFLKEQHLNLYKVNLSTFQEEQVEKAQCLYTIPYSKINLQASIPKCHEIEAG
jgi:hypothetical protein